LSVQKQSSLKFSILQDDVVKATARNTFALLADADFHRLTLLWHRCSGSRLEYIPEPGATFI
jgi:hypothetical protein